MAKRRREKMSEGKKNIIFREMARKFWFTDKQIDDMKTPLDNL